MAPGASGELRAPRSETLLLTLRVGARHVAIPAEHVERVLPMAALTPVPDAPSGVAGALSVQGATLLVVDPRSRLDTAAVTPDPSQHLVLVRAGAQAFTTRYLLWVDEASQMVAAPASALEPLAVDSGAGVSGVAAALARIGDQILPVLSPQSLSPRQV